MQTSITFPVDAEHSGIRIAVFAAFIGLSVVGFFVAQALLSTIALVSIVIAVVIAGVTSLGLERLLKRTWPSGRHLHIDDHEIQLRQHNTLQTSITTSAPVTSLFWYFKISRRARVPKGWYVVSSALEQEDTTLAVYTLMSPEYFNMFEPPQTFDALTSTTTDGEPMRVAGKRKRLERAESVRWQTGVEMTNEDFRDYLEAVERLFGL